VSGCAGAADSVLHVSAGLLNSTGKHGGALKRFGAHVVQVVTARLDCSVRERKKERMERSTEGGGGGAGGRLFIIGIAELVMLRVRQFRL
jgi:hypothetical protein